ncbi:hypothetical protein MFIFM68171_02105 [Madurella fahalii]|uniref:Uncharacterized protein n=1 Tax=Madurella fahalii TaxID=1157608 RepID=A0ABQ0G2W0_9PEZI
MLKEIYTWFVENLRDGTITPMPRTPGDGLMVKQAVQTQSPNNTHFALYVQSPNGQKLLCPTACLHQGWTVYRRASVGSSGLSSTQQPVFECQCRDLLTGASGSPGPHHAAVCVLALSYFSFPMRLAGKTSAWMIYKATDRSRNRLVSLVITGIATTRIAEFE